MKKRIFSLLICLALLLPTVPILTNAANFVASRKSDVFHQENCFYVDRILTSNKVYYDTVEEAERAGKHGCSRCKPSSINSSSAITKSSKNDSISNNSYQNGYNKGYTKGYEDGEKAASLTLEEDIRKARKSGSSSAYLTSLFIGAPVVVYMFNSYSSMCKQKYESELVALRNEIKTLKKNSNYHSFAVAPTISQTQTKAAKNKIR